MKTGDIVTSIVQGERAVTHEVDDGSNATESVQRALETARELYAEGEPFRVEVQELLLVNAGGDAEDVKLIFRVEFRPDLLKGLEEEKPTDALPYDVKWGIINSAAWAVSGKLLEHLLSVQWKPQPNAKPWARQAVRLAEKEGRIERGMIRDHITMMWMDPPSPEADVMALFTEAMYFGMSSAVITAAQHIGKLPADLMRSKDDHLMNNFTTAFYESLAQPVKLKWSRRGDQRRVDYWSAKEK